MTNEGMASVTASDGNILTAVNATLNQLGKLLQPNQSTTDAPKLEADKKTEEAVRVFTMVMMVGVCAVLSVFGVISNILNIMVFVKQGFQDTVNISLFSISISDLFSALTLLWLGICQNPLFYNADLPFLPLEIEAVTGGIPHAISMNVTGWLTALVTFERCLCVVFPLKIKDIVSRKRTFVIVTIIFVMVIGGHIPYYYMIRPGWKFIPARNKTVLGVHFLMHEYFLLNQLTQFLSNVGGTSLTFLCVIVCSGILVIHMNFRSKWRQSATATGDSGKEGSLTTRDWKVIKMVTTVAIVFVSCFTPSVVISILMASEPEYSFHGKYQVVYKIHASIAALLEAINPCANIFLYYKMSSKYKSEFRAIIYSSADESTK